jgi:hypothetical protein
MDDVTVTWMDGKQETYPIEKWEVTDSGRLLWLTREANMLPPYCVPLANVRVWTVG